MNKKELKIFLTFFFLYLFFVQWTTWDEQAIFDLTRAILDEGRLEIDTYHNNTGARIFYNEHYYSRRNPGLSFLALPIYSINKFVNSIYESFIKFDVNEKLVYYYKSVPFTYETKPTFFYTWYYVFIDCFNFFFIFLIDSTTNL